MELIRSEPILRYEFLALDDGFVRDLSGHGHDARLRGEASIVPDERFARCLDLDGSEGHLTIPFTPVLQPRRAFTIEAWLRRSGNDANASVLQYPRRANEDLKFEYGMELSGGRLATRIAGESPGIAGHEPLESGSWHHLAVTWDGEVGRVSYYLDGESAGEHEAGVPELLYGTAHELLIGCGATGSDAFHGRLASLRLYERALTAEEIRRDLHADERERFSFEDSHPIAFRFFDHLDENRMFVTDDTSPGRSAHLVLTNRTPFDIVLPETQGAVPTPEDHHIELCFRSGTLAGDTVDGMSVAEAGWMSSVEEREDKTTVVRLSYPHRTVLRAGRRLALTLQHVKADPFGGARSSQVELRFRGMNYDGESFELTGHRLEHVDVVNQTGRRRPILRAGFTGSDLVMNDGETPNRLRLYLGNSSKVEHVRLRSRTDPAPTRLTLAFEAGNEDETWAVGTIGQLQEVDVIPEDSVWHMDKQRLGESPIWIFTLDEERSLGPGAEFGFAITKLVTSLPSGTANLFVHYENVPGHWDGELVCPIRKAPRRLAGDDPRSRAPLPAADLERDGLEVLGRIKDKNLAFGEDRILARRAGEKAPLFLQPEGGKVTVGSVETSVDGAVAKPSSLDVVGGIQAFGEIRDKDGLVVPRGVIVMWSGSKVPSGWQLCDSEREVEGVKVPNLSGRFVVGRDPSQPDYSEIGNRGGENEVRLEEKHLPAHSHDVTVERAGEHRHRASQAVTVEVPGGLTPNPFAGTDPVVSNVSNTTVDGDHEHPAQAGDTGHDQPHENRPPYYVLAYIIKV